MRLEEDAAHHLALLFELRANYPRLYIFVEEKEDAVSAAFQRRSNRPHGVELRWQTVTWLAFAALA
jgi:hypothetical protein